jgi:GT2 family glycosyltransferase
VSENGRYGRMASPLALLHYGDGQALGTRTAVGANLVIRRHVYDALDGFARHRGRIRGTLLCGEDHDFCKRAVAAGFRCEYRPELRVRHWVPAARASLRYFTRWFFWSGVTNAMLAAAAHRSAEPLVPQYLLRRILVAPFAGLRFALAGCYADAATQLFDAAFAIGYIGQNIRSRGQAGDAAPALAQKT